LAVHSRRRLATADWAAHPFQLTRELELVARLHDALEPHVVDPREERKLAVVRLVGEHGYGAGLRHGLDDEDAGHDRPAGKVAREIPLVLANTLAGNRSRAGLELHHLVQQEEGISVRDDLLDLRAAQSCLHACVSSSRCALT